MTVSSNNKVYTVAQIASVIDAEVIGSDDLQITGVNTIAESTASQICFLSSAKIADKLLTSRAGAVIVKDQMADISPVQLKVANVEAALIEVLKLYAPDIERPKGIHPSAVIEDTATIGTDVSIGPMAHIAHGATIGDSTIIAAGVKVGQDVVIGKNCRIDANTVIYHDCTIGDNCVLSANVTIGADGFGYSFIDGAHRLIPHNGGVILEDYVEIGANSCVDRAKFGNTIVGAGTKMDNLVQVGHNVIIGKCCLLVSQVAIGGSARLGDGVVMAGQTGVAEHVKIADGAMFAGRSGVSTDIEKPGQYWGFPAISMERQTKILAANRQVPNMKKKLSQLAKKVAELEKKNTETQR